MTTPPPSPATPKPPRPLGAPLLRLLIVFGAVVAYAVLWGLVFAWIWKAGNGPAPTVSDKILYALAVLGGVLGSFFAASLGIERKDPEKDAKKFAFGSTIVGLDTGGTLLTATATFALWLYAFVGLFAMLTVFVYTKQSPPMVSAMASSFATLVVGLVGGALVPGQNTGG